MSNGDPKELATDIAPVSVTNGNGHNMMPALFEKAIDKLSGPGAESAVAALEKLMDLHERIEKREAEKAFNAGMVEFQQQCPAVLKNKTAKVATRKGGTFSYDYADIHQIQKTVKPILNGLGFTYSLDQEYRDGRIWVAFILSHKDGHSRTSRFSCPEDSDSAASNQQKSGVADTYAARRAMRHALGIMDDDDTDGAPAAPVVSKITDDQIANLQALIDETKPDMAKFLGYFDVKSVADLTAAQLPKAISMLEQKRRKQ